MVARVLLREARREDSWAEHDEEEEAESTSRVSRHTCRNRKCCYGEHVKAGLARPGPAQAPPSSPVTACPAGTG